MQFVIKMGNENSSLKTNGGTRTHIITASNFLCVKKNLTLTYSESSSVKKRKEKKLLHKISGQKEWETETEAFSPSLRAYSAI